MPPSKIDSAKLLDVVRTFAAASPAAPASIPASIPAALAAHRFCLGAGAVARTTRRVADRPWTDALTDVGVRVTATPSESSPERVVVDASAPGAIVCATLTARAQLGPGVRVLVGRRAKRWLDLSREALAPLIVSSEIDVEEAVELVADGAGVFGGDAARTAVVVAPYYYLRHELDRIARTVALEAAEPSPHAEVGLEMWLSRAWEQRDLFVSRVREHLATLSPEGEPDARMPTAHILEASDVEEVLDEAAGRVAGATTVAAYVYPLWRERPTVEAALSRLASRSRLTVVNQTPSFAWGRGVGANLGTTLVDVDARWVSTRRPAVAARLARYELAPSATRALGVTLAQWTGL